MSIVAAILISWSAASAPPPDLQEPAPVAMALAAPAPQAQDTILQYQARELAATDLERFRGGSEGLVLFIVLVAAVLILIAIILPW